MHENVKNIIEGCNGSSYINNEYLFDNRLTPTEKTLYATIFAISHNPKHPEYCYPRQDTLAELIGRSVRTVQRCLKNLVLYGYIQIKRRGSISNLYYVLAKVGKQIVDRLKRAVQKDIPKQDYTVNRENAKNSDKKSSRTKNYYKKTSTFNDYTQRNYNFDKLEQALLGTGSSKVTEFSDLLIE